MDYLIITDPDGSHHATNGRIGMSVLPDKLTPNLFRPGQAKLFKRCAYKNAMTPAVEQVTWLVGELDGVKCYVKYEPSGMLHIVMTRQEMYP
jgi:hypothetical protein